MDRAAELLNDVDSHRVADILQDLSEEEAAAVAAVLDRPQDVVPRFQYPPNTAGTPTVTLVMRGLAFGDFPHHAGFRLLARELLLGLLHGLALALLAGLEGWVWKGGIGLGLAIGIATVGNLLAAALAGAGVPLLLRRLGINPAVSSAVFVTTFTDVFGFLIFLAAGGLLVRRWDDGLVEPRWRSALLSLSELLYY